MTSESTVDKDPVEATVDEGAADDAAPGGAVIGPRIAGGGLLAVGLLLLLNAVQGAADDGVTLGGPRVGPIVVAGAWVLLSAIYLVRQLIAPEGGRIVVRVPALLVVLLVAYMLVLKYSVVGYIIATMVFFFLTARLLSSRPLREVVVRDACVAVGLSVGIYLAFTRLLDISLPAGVLPL